MRQLFFAVAASAVLLAGCDTMGDMDGRMPAAMPADMTPNDRAAYVEMAGASDLFEIRSSQLALQRARSPQLRDFAQMLVTHHSQTTQQLMAAARSSGMRPPAPMLMPMQERMMRDLEQAAASAFERVYMDQQVPAHEMALALHENYARNGDTPALRTVAAAAVPIVTQHLQRARQLD